MMQLHVYRYRLPFIQPVITGSATFRAREGLLLVLEENGITAFGEAAPLPGYSPETLEEVLSHLSHHFKDLKTGIGNQLSHTPNDPIPGLAPYPSLQFAIDTLLADYHSQKKQVPVRKSLFSSSKNKIPLNILLPAGDTGDALEEAKRCWKLGYRTFKLKTGVDFERELEILQRIRKKLPGARIRIDANQSWGFEEARENLERLSGTGIEYCEEPIHNPTVKRLNRLHLAADIPLALDESLHRNSQRDDWIRQKTGQVIIIKPMLYGGFQNIFATYRLAVTHDYKAVFTTTLESGIGRIMTAILASGLGSPQFAHGLATGGFLKMDVWYDRTYIDSGYFNLPDGYGLGKKHRPRIQDLEAEPLDL